MSAWVAEELVWVQQRSVFGQRLGPTSAPAGLSAKEAEGAREDSEVTRLVARLVSAGCVYEIFHLISKPG